MLLFIIIIDYIDTLDGCDGVVFKRRCFKSVTRSGITYSRALQYCRAQAGICVLFNILLFTLVLRWYLLLLTCFIRS